MMGAKSPHYIPGEFEAPSGEDTLHTSAGNNDVALLARRIVYQENLFGNVT